MTLSKQKHENNSYLSNSQDLKLTSTKGSYFCYEEAKNYMEKYSQIFGYGLGQYSFSTWCFNELYDVQKQGMGSLVWMHT
jgi:hypothetical protein